MPRRNSLNTFLAIAAGAATTVTALEYRRQRGAAMARLGKDSQMIDTVLGPAEVALMGDGPAVLVLHGALGGYDQSVQAAQMLADTGYRVIAPSRPGYLRTPAIEDMSFAGQADFLAALLDALKVKDAILMGISAGGPFAVQFAARYPDRCRALLLVCAISQRFVADPENETGSTWMFRTFMQSDFLTWMGVQGMLKSLPLMALTEPGGWRARIMASPTRRAEFEKMLWALFPSSPRLKGAQYDLSLDEHMDDLPFKRVKAPALVLHGTADSLVPYAHGEYSAKRIAGARLVTVPGGDHSFFVSHDDVVWPEVLGFLKRSATKAKSAAKKPAARKPAAKKAAPETKPKVSRSARKTPATGSRASTTATRRRPSAAK